MRIETEIKVIPASPEREETRVTYIAEDGKRFDKADQCKFYEEYLEYLHSVAKIKRKKIALPEISEWCYVENKDQIFLVRNELGREIAEIDRTIGFPKVGEWCGAYKDYETYDLYIITLSRYKEMVEEFLNSFETVPTPTFTDCVQHFLDDSAR